LICVTNKQSFVLLVHESTQKIMDFNPNLSRTLNSSSLTRNGTRRGVRTPKTTIINHNFVKFGNYSRYKTISSSIVLSQQRCEVYEKYFISYSSEAVMRLTTK